MTKEEKRIVMNGITNYALEIERLFPNLISSIEFGLHKGKLGIADYIAMRCRQLADELDTYLEDDFSLEDMQDYHDWKK